MTPQYQAGQRRRTGDVRSGLLTRSKGRRTFGPDAAHECENTRRRVLDITRRGLDLVGPDGERAARIRQAQATFTWMAEVFDNAPPLDQEQA
ncbi:hypothetical protein ACFWY5_56485 [Nonomuraea sp. NPDC059007]|uniref:hypothetical protein n=1 Tax=Nonomuraea sp. NPDC059007 TaxID=3346692 RepID=UPI0036A48E77